MNDLFDHYPAVPGAAPVDTSISAAEKIKPNVSVLRQTVLDALRDYGPQTTEELEATTGIEYCTVQPRTSELSAAGLIIKHGSRPNSRGNNIKVWYLPHQLSTKQEI